MFFPFRTPANNVLSAGKPYLSKINSLFAFDEIKADAVEIEPDHFFIAVPDIAEVCLQQYFYVTLMRQDFFRKGP